MNLPTQPAPRGPIQLATEMVAPAHLGGAIDDLAAPIAFWDQRMCNRYANVAYASWYGMTPLQMYGVHIHELLGEASFQRNLPSLRRVLSGLSETFETRLQNALGHVRDVQVTTTPLIIDNTVTGFSVLFVDLSARVYSEAALRVQHKEKAVREER
ncbi:MAG: hypothetical protein QOH89_1343, partial [Pseudonocardiales bacterium]|nr:hypothetical protein [Pseudonocardiales bacterium]